MVGALAAGHMVEAFLGAAPTEAGMGAGIVEHLNRLMP